MPDDTYRIKQGDNFWKIENELNLPHGTLEKLNPDLNPRTLVPNQKINVFSWEVCKTNYQEELGSARVMAVFYHGGPFGKGKTTTAEKAGGAGKIYTATQLATVSTGREFIGRVIAPGATSASGVNNGLVWIEENYKEGDQLIIYGYSYGVDVAVDLATSLKKLSVPVDLLVTVDGSDGPMQNLTVNTKIPNNVRVNFNIYQTARSGKSSSTKSSDSSSGSSSNGSSSGSSSNSSNNGSSNSGGSMNSPGSHGGPNSAISPNKTTVINKNVSADGLTHGNIQTKMQSIIQAKIKKHILNYKHEIN